MKPYFLCLLALSLSSVATAASDHFDSPPAGISFDKPSSWVFVSRQPAQERRGNLRLTDAELEQQIKGGVAAPLAVVMAHPEPWPELNPTFQVGLRLLGELEGKSAAEILTFLLPTLELVYPEFHVMDPVSAVSIGGLPAARLGAQYTIKTEAGGAIPTRSEMIIVPRGKLIFFIGTGRSPDDKAAEASLESILSSLKIQQ